MCNHGCLLLSPLCLQVQGIEVDQVELMLYVQPLQEKRCAGGHFLEVVVCEWALSGSMGER